VIGAVFFAAVTAPTPAGYAHALGAAVEVALLFVLAAVSVGLFDLFRSRQRSRAAG
jgi:hypothetical protein